MDRVEIAYMLMAAMLAFVTGIVAWRIYHSRERTYRRRTARENAAYAAAQNVDREPR